MRKLQDLTAADFPGVDPTRFHEWQVAQYQAQQSFIFLCAALVLLDVILLLTVGAIALGGLLFFFILFLSHRKAARLRKELGIEDAAIKSALQREVAPFGAWDEAAQPEFPKSIPETLLGIFIFPARTFAEIVRNPDFLPPLVVALVATIGVAEAMLTKIGMERIIRTQLERSGRALSMNPDQLEQIIRQSVTFGTVFAHASFLFAPLGILIIAAIGLAIVNFIFGSQVSFKTAFSVTCYANLVSVLGALLAVPIIMFGDPEHFNAQSPVPSNLGFFLDPTGNSKFLVSLAGSFDILTIWFTVLLAIGFSEATRRKVGTASIFFCLLGLWIIWVMIKAGLATLG